MFMYNFRPPVIFSAPARKNKVILRSCEDAQFQIMHSFDCHLLIISGFVRHYCCQLGLNAGPYSPFGRASSDLCFTVNCSDLRLI
jgi:hypothetical protein